MSVLDGLSVLTLAIWCGLLFVHGRFWESKPSLPDVRPRSTPAVDVIIPARNEEETIGAAIGSLAAQDYEGVLSLILVNDGSTDQTAGRARLSANGANLRIVEAAPKPPHWSGKVWALDQGVVESEADLLLFTDADIVHAPGHISALVAQAEADNLDLVSEMVALRCESLAERALIPAFVYFFQLLYPFSRVNDASSGTAAAAGGVLLVRRSALSRIGGLNAISSALIDDVALGTKIKRVGRIWLGHATQARSIRPYPGFADVWRMVTRTAFVQLRFSVFALLGSLLGMALVWLVPPTAVLFGGISGRLFGALAWAGMAGSFWPTLARYRLSPLWAVVLPAIALFYMAATIGSAVNHWRGKSVAWKNRFYQGAAV